MLVKNLLLAGIAAISLAKVTAQQYNKYYGPPPPWNTETTQNIYGSPMLLDDWTTGKIVTEQGKEIADSSLLFNYNKANNELNVTMDRQSFFGIDRKVVQSFTLHTTEGDVFFCKMPQIDKNMLFQLVATGKNFNVYKKVITSIKSTDTYKSIILQNQSSGYYHTVVYVSPNAQAQAGHYPKNVYNAGLNNGVGPGPNDSLVTGGANYAVYKRIVQNNGGGLWPLVYNYNNGNAGFYDKGKRYEDWDEYYIVENLGDKLLTAKFHLTKTSIDNAFGYYSADKADQYMKEHRNTSIDENFVKNIADYFNQYAF